jgi:hypothetical protein
VGSEIGFTTVGDFKLEVNVRRISRRAFLGAAGTGAAAVGLGHIGSDVRSGSNSATSAPIAPDGPVGLDFESATQWLNPELEAQIRSNFANGMFVAPPREVPSAQAVGIDTSAARRVEGYVDATSVNIGETVNVRASSTLGAFTVSFLRIGWYGGAGAREVYRSAAISGVRQSIPAWDATGLVACKWPVSLSVDTSGWEGGYYLAALIPLSTGVAESYVPFVVRDDSSSAPIVMQIPFSTYQAYNTWGGKSMYYGADGKRADRVSSDRPYDLYAGTAHLFYGDFQLICWLERNGYPVTYVASEDTHARPDLMNRRKLFLVAHHDEYWSQSMRNNLKSWLGSGKSLAMASCNNIYWRVRYESSESGVANRVMACWKIAATDPNQSELSVRFVELGQSEVELEGVEYEGNGPTAVSWVVTNAGHWIYAGTGVSNGTVLPNLVGTEWDAWIPAAPKDTQIIAASPAVSVYEGPQTHNAVVRETAAGSVVFSAGSLFFAMFYGGPVAPAESPVVSKMTKNLLTRIGIGPGDPPPPVTTTTRAPQPTPTRAVAGSSANPAPKGRIAAGGATAPAPSVRRPAG